MTYRKKGSAAEEANALLERCQTKAKLLSGYIRGWEQDQVGGKLEAVCGKGHDFSLFVAGFLYKDRWCPFCQDRGIASLEVAKSILRGLDLELQNSPRMDTDSATVACLLCGRAFQDSLGRLRRKKSLCACKKDLARRTKNLDRLEAYVSDRGGFLNNPRPVFTSEKVDVRCASGHSWKVLAGSLLSQKTWCPRCAGNFKRSLDQLQDIVEKRGGKLISKTYKGVDALYEYECNLGHRNRNQFKKIEKGQWCLTCNKNSKSEEITRAILENLFGTKFPKNRPEWLRNSRGRRMELDGFAEDISVAFEFQGAQHFLANTYFKNDLAQRIEDDRIKAELCRKNNVSLLIFTYLDKYEDFHIIAKRQLETFGIIVDCDYQKPVNFEAAYIRDDRLEELTNLLRPKAIKVLSTKWSKVDDYYEFECEVCNTKFKAKAQSYFNSRRVAGCDFCNRQQPRNKKNIESLVSFAVLHGGELISDTYVRRNHIYKWKCSAGHVFDANFNYLAYTNKFCPSCENRQTKEKLTHDQVVELFRGFGYELMGKYEGRTRYVKTACLSCGFQGSQTLENLRSGKQRCRGCVLTTKKDEARRKLAANKIEPLEDWPEKNRAWRCKCLVCGHEFALQLGKLGSRIQCEGCQLQPKLSNFNDSRSGISNDFD
jgi:hypothetical protein